MMCSTERCVHSTCARCLTYSIFIYTLAALQGVSFTTTSNLGFNVLHKDIWIVWTKVRIALATEAQPLSPMYLKLLVITHERPDSYLPFVK